MTERDEPSGAGPAISVVVPVHNAEATLAGTLDALLACAGADFEVIVVDDGSTDRSLDIARRYACRIERMPENRGPAAARNRGAAAARGAVLFFTDADVLVLPDTLAKVADVLAANPGVAAVIGSYTIATPSADFVSSFKNLVHHFTHQTSRPEAATFWAACGAVRREAFAAVGGFDERYRRASVEDIELGYRLRGAGYRILLDPTIQVVHCKRYRFLDLVRSDVLHRAVPWTTLMLKERTLRNDLNTTRGNAVALVAAYLLLFCLLGAPLAPRCLLGALLAFAVLAVCNGPFYACAYRFRGPGFLLRAIPMNVLFYLYSGVGLTLGVAAYLREARR